MSHPRFACSIARKESQRLDWGQRNELRKRCPVRTPRSSSLNKWNGEEGHRKAQVECDCSKGENITIAMFLHIEDIKVIYALYNMFDKSGMKFRFLEIILVPELLRSS